MDEHQFLNVMSIHAGHEKDNIWVCHRFTGIIQKQKLSNPSRKHLSKSIKGKSVAKPAAVLYYHNDVHHYSLPTRSAT